MLLRNYYGLLAISEFSLVTREARTIDATSYALTGKIKNKSGTAITSIPAMYIWGNLRAGSVTLSGIIVGSGTTAVQMSDYCLENPIATAIYTVTRTSPRIAFDSTTGDLYTEKTFVITNTSNSAITINEWGMVSDKLNVLFYREVFQTPKVLNHGETLSITVRTSIATPYISS